MAESTQNTTALEKIIKRAAAFLTPDRHLTGYLRNPYQLNPLLVLLNALQIIKRDPKNFKKLDLLEAAGKALPLVVSGEEITYGIKSGRSDASLRAADIFIVYNVVYNNPKKAIGWRVSYSISTPLSRGWMLLFYARHPRPKINSL